MSAFRIISKKIGLVSAPVIPGNGRFHVLRPRVVSADDADDRDREAASARHAPPLRLPLRSDDPHGPFPRPHWAGLVLPHRLSALHTRQGFIFGTHYEMEETETEGTVLNIFKIKGRHYSVPFAFAAQSRPH